MAGGQLRIGKPKEAIAGSLFMVIGAAAWLGAHQYHLGTPTNMGPGYFPQILGLALLTLGAANLLRSFAPATETEPGVPRALTPLLLILAGVVGFWLLIDRAGLAVAILALIAFACAPQLLRRPWEVLLIYLILTAFSIVVFITAFGMPFRAF